MNIKKLYLSLITASVLAALSSVPALALSNYTLNGNYVITGDLYVDSLLGHVGQCLEVGTGPLGASEIVATGSPCGGGGGGGVTSVTANDPDGNLTIAPTTGAVIVSMSDSPTFDEVTSTDMVTAGSSFTSQSMDPFFWRDYHNNVVKVESDATHSLNGVINEVFSIRYSPVGIYLITLDHLGDEAIAGTFHAANIVDLGLAPSSSVCTDGSSQLTTSGCSGGGGGVSSVTNTDGNLAIAPTTGAVVANLANSVSILNSLTVGSGGGMTSLETNTTNTGSLTVDGLIDAAGNITFAGAGASLPVCTNGSSQLTTTGCSGGGGGVTSVTAGPSGNLTFAPTTGSVVGDITESPTFTGLTTIGTSGSGGSQTAGALAFGNNVGLTTFYAPASGCDISAINAYAICIAYDGTPEFSMDNTGRLGVKDLFDANLASAAGQSLVVGGSGQINPSGFTSVQILHGNQSITAVASACTAGTPITFTTPFTAVPDIVGSTGPIVGDTFAPTAITTTGFTPEVCSVASAAPVTVYWSAQN